MIIEKLSAMAHKYKLQDDQKIKKDVEIKQDHLLQQDQKK
jgi:hypothetical protein